MINLTHQPGALGVQVLRLQYWDEELSIWWKGAGAVAEGAAQRRLFKDTPKTDRRS